MINKQTNQQTKAMPNLPNVVEDFIEGGQREDHEGAGQQAAAAPAHQPAVVPTGNANIELEESMAGMNNDEKMNLILLTMMSMKRDVALMKEDMALMATKEDMALVSKNVEKLMVAAPAAALPANTSYVVGNGAVQVGNAVESGGSQTWSIVEHNQE